MKKIFLYTVLIVSILTACNKNSTQENTNDSTALSDTETKELPVYKGILTYGKSVKEFKQLPEGTIYHLHDNSHRLKKVIDSLHLVAYEPVYIEFIADSTAKPTEGSALNYSEVIYLRKIIKISEEAGKNKNSGKDTVVVSKEQKICFKAMGNEPAWYITMNATDIKLNLNMGSEKYTFPAVHALRYKESTVIKTQSTDTKIYLIISDEKCFDTMSGKEFGHRTKLIVNDSVAYFGCGNYIKNCQ